MKKVKKKFSYFPKATQIVNDEVRIGSQALAATCAFLHFTLQNVPSGYFTGTSLQQYPATFNYYFGKSTA